jgi:hypothetical protein
VAKPSYTLITATGTFAFYPDWIQSPFNLSYAVELAAGTSATYTMSYTLDDVNQQIDHYGSAAWTPIWLPDLTLGGTTTVSAGGYYSFPIRGLRVVVSALSGGNARFAVLQGQSSR